MRHRLLGTLYIQVLIAIAVGAAVGFLWPEYGAAMKPLGDGFIKLVKMLIAPIVFATVVAGIAKMGAMRDVGRIGFRALVYFELVTTLALVIGLVVVAWIQPGAGIHFDPASVDQKLVASYTNASQHLTPTEFVLNVIPDTVLGAFARGDILQVLLFSVPFGLVLLKLQERARPLVDLISLLSSALFEFVGLIMRLAPIGAFGAMAYTVGEYGLGTLFSLGKLMLAVYLTCGVFVVVVLGSIMAACGFSVFRFLAYIRDEILIVLGTSSSESALPRLMNKLEDLGCSKPVVGMVVPTGYSFNLDGTSIYMTMAAMFVAQASGVHMSVRDQLGLLAVLLLTSKGAAAVAGGGFVTLAATLAVFPSIPVAGLTLLVGVDRFMSEARSITNLIGNGVATVVIAKWEGALDLERANRILKRADARTKVPARHIFTDTPPHAAPPAAPLVEPAKNA
jgi:aerobic C4-dicarboxylate transport protein